MYIGSLSREQDKWELYWLPMQLYASDIIDTGDPTGSYINIHKYLYLHRLQGAWTFSNGKLV